MTNTIKLYATGLLLIGLTSCNSGEKNQAVEINTPEEVKEQKEETPDYFDAAFADGMVGKVFNNYLEVQAALVNSDLDDAKAAASNLAEGFDQERPELKTMAKQMAEAESLEDLRKHFSDFTGKVEPLLTKSITEGSIYKQYCPMAFDNAGAYWISDAQEIKNPYFGEKMLKCGSTKKVITKQ